MEARATTAGVASGALQAYPALGALVAPPPADSPVLMKPAPQDLVGFASFPWTSGGGKGSILPLPVKRGRKAASLGVAYKRAGGTPFSDSGIPGSGSGGIWPSGRMATQYLWGVWAQPSPTWPFQLCLRSSEFGRLVQVGETWLPAYVREQVSCSQASTIREASPRCSERGVQVCR